MFFTLRVIKHWQRLFGDILEFTSLQILKSYLDAALSVLLQLTMPTAASSTGRPPKELLGISHSVTDRAIAKKSLASVLGYSLHLED